jgi:hypothetical protein
LKVAVKSFLKMNKAIPTNNFWKDQQDYNAIVHAIKSKDSVSVYKLFASKPRIVDRFRTELMWISVNSGNEYATVKLQRDNRARWGF